MFAFSSSSAIPLTTNSVSSSAPPVTSNAPTQSLLAGLTHLSSGLVSSSSSSNASRKRGKKGKGSHLQSAIRSGSSVSKFFNDVAGRPYPRFSDLEQSIRVTLTSAGATLFFTSTTTPTYASAQFALGQYGDATSYLQLFDQYRVEQVEVWIEPAAPQGTTTFGALATAVDLDDNNTPTTFATVAEKQQALIGMGAASHYHRWCPHIAVSSYSGTFTSYANAPSMWLDSNSPNVYQFGLKTAAGPTPVAVSYLLSSRIVVSFRAPGL
jgi:hypothetical protein